MKSILNLIVLTLAYVFFNSENTIALEWCLLVLLIMNGIFMGIFLFQMDLKNSEREAKQAEFELKEAQKELLNSKND